MSFNFIPATEDEIIQEEELPVIYELARDLDSLELLVKDGKFYYVSKNDALKIWILKALNMQTSRYNFRAYSNDYGNEISRLFGYNLAEPLLQSELQRIIKEALLVNPYIVSVENFTFEKRASYVKVAFLVNTVYGALEQEISYNRE